MSSHGEATRSMEPAKHEEGVQHPIHEKHPTEDLVRYLTEYARERPDVAALWCFGIGFILGWKLKPW